MCIVQRYADFFHSAADGLLVIAADGQVLFSNPRAHEITGRSEAELGRGTFAGLVDPADLPRLSQIRAGFAQDEFPHMVDLSIRRQAPGGGDRRTLSVSFGSVLHEDGGAILVSFRDVTAERATEAELTKTKDFLERVIESSADAIVSADTTGLVLLYNRAAERTFGHPAAEVVGRRNARDLYPPGLARDIMRLIRSNEHGVPGRLEGYRTEVLSRDGTRIPVLLSAALILENGAPFGSVGVITDLRERLRMEARLEEAQEALRAREKQAIVAELAGAAAHELNQPLTSVIGYADIIRRRVGGDSPVANAAAVILEEAGRMADIVRKIGKITRYETKMYVGTAKIIDLDRASDDEPGGTSE